jgi:hypothetical protein
MKFHEFFQKIRGRRYLKSVRLPLNIKKICKMQNVKEFEGGMHRRPFFGNI